MIRFTDVQPESAWGTVFQIPWTYFDKKTVWPQDGMQILQNLGFKTAAMALRDDSVGLMTKHSVQKKNWQSFSEQKVTALHHRPSQTAIIQ